MLKFQAMDRLQNPYLEEFKQVRGDHLWVSHTTRHALVQKYAWAVPNTKAVLAIAGLNRPILEIGAGNGYWAWLLRQLGCVVHPYDIKPVEDNEYVLPKSYVPISLGGPDVVKSHTKDVALMLCWPCYDLPVAYDALNLYQGDTVVYIGEGRYGCTGDDAFHDLLEDFYYCEKSVDIPQWGGLHDALYIFKAK